MERSLSRSDRPSTSAVDAEGVADLVGDLRSDVEELTRFGDRKPGSAGHAQARTYLARRLVRLGVPTYAGEDHLVPFGPQLVNVLATIHGSDRHRRPVVLATNYDTSVGGGESGDNAACIAVILAVVPRLQAALERGVIVALLDDAAPRRHRDTATGATVLLSDQRRHDLKAAVVLDRLGRRRAAGSVPPDGTVFVTGCETDARMPSVLGGAERHDLRFAPVHRRYRGEIALSAPFVDAGLPYLELFGPHDADGLDTREETLDFTHLARLVPVVEALIRRLDVARLPGPFEGYDSAPFELEALAALTDERERPEAPRDARARVDDAIRRFGGILAS
ncbi:hypothetical protein BH23DEI1_BH23DEI1_21270 [soil metagenome]